MKKFVFLAGVAVVAAGAYYYMSMENEGMPMFSASEEESMMGEDNASMFGQLKSSTTKAVNDMQDMTEEAMDEAGDMAEEAMDEADEMAEEVKSMMTGEETDSMMDEMAEEAEEMTDDMEKMADDMEEAVQ